MNEPIDQDDHKGRRKKEGGDDDGDSILNIVNSKFNLN